MRRRPITRLPHLARAGRSTCRSRKLFSPGGSESLPTVSAFRGWSSCRGIEIMLLKFLIVVAVLVVLLFIFIATRPAAFSVSRSATMSAEPSAVFRQVNDFHKWEAWSPWAKIDPNAKSTFDGAASGVGAKFAWDGNKNVGAGNMTITESVPNDHIRIRLEFIRPF